MPYTGKFLHSPKTKELDMENNDQYSTAKEVMLKLLETKPDWFNPKVSDISDAKQLAQTLWEFMDEYVHQEALRKTR